MKVEYVTHLGDDLLVANTARKSFGRGFETFRTIEDGPRSPRGRSDEQLIYDLANDGHWLPFRHPHITVACSEALPIARQLGKHQVGMDWSEISRRYKTKDISFTRLGGEWRWDVADRKQGSGELMGAEWQQELAALQEANIQRCIDEYEYALSIGAAPEQARYLLPQSMEVEWTWTGSLLSFAHVYKQRNHKDAQRETQLFAKEAGKIAEKLFPYSWRALTQ